VTSQTTMRGYASVAVLALADSAEDAAAEDHGEELHEKEKQVVRSCNKISLLLLSKQRLALTIADTAELKN